MAITRRLTLLFGLFLSLSLSGCAQNMIYGVVVEGYPKMAERYAELTPVGSADARIVLYWPEKTFFEGHSIRMVVDGGNGSVEPLIGYRTAELLDLPAGKYSIGIADDERKIILQAQPGTTYCLNAGEFKIWSSGKQTATDQMVEEPKPIPTETCVSDFSKDDIRCGHKECLVKTIVPKSSAHFQQYATDMDHDKLQIEARNFDIAKDVSRIYITRKLYTLGMVRVGVDGDPEAKVESSSFVAYEVEPGEHTIVVAVGGPHNIVQAYRVSTEPGGCYFFHSDSFKFLSGTEGRRLVMDYDLLEQGFYKQ